MRLLLFLVLLLATTLASPRAAHAHAGRPDAVELAITSDRTAIITVGGAVVVHVDGCEAGADAAGRSLVVTCAGPIVGRRLRVDGIAPGRAVVVTTRRPDDTSPRTDVLSARASSLAIGGREDTRGLVLRFVRIGVAHVLSGLDHVLFLLVLAWQVLARARGRRALVALARAATTFTVAHAATLAATALGALHVSTSAAEGAIAASLVLVALDVDAEHARARRTDLAMIFVFGLVHGLGFASGLADAGMPPDRSVVALVAFNVGIEVAQVLVLGGAVVLASAVRRVVTDVARRTRFLHRAATASAYAVGVTGAWLFFSRVIALRGP